MPSSYDGDIRLSVSLDPENVVKSTDKLTKQIEATFNAVSGKNVDAGFKKIQVAMDKAAAKAVKLRDEMSAFDNDAPMTESMSKYYNELGVKLGQVNNEMRVLLEQAASYSSKQDTKITDTRTTEELQKQVDLARQVSEEWKRNDAAGEWTKDIGAGIETTSNALDGLLARQQQLESTPGGIESEEYQNVTAQIEELSGSLENLQWEEEYGAEQMSKLVSAILATESPIARVKESIKELGKNLMEMAGSKISGFFSGLRDKIIGVGNSSKGADINFSKMFKNFLRYGLGVRSLFALFNKLRNAIKEGFANLMQFNGGSNSVANTVNSLKDSLTTLKNSWAAAFAPILQMVAPILQYLINMLITAANAIATFFAALGGQGKVIKATKAQQGLGSAIGGTGDAAEKAKGQLADFDELNIIGDQSGSGGGGGGGGGAGGLGGFEYEDIGSDMTDFIDKLKKSWEDADFTWLGTLLGEKLRDALEKSYEFLTTKAMDFAWRLAKSLATFLNGFIEVDGLADIIGKNIGAALNVAFNFVNTFLREFHWDSLGKFISSGFMSAFQEFDWGNISGFLSGQFIAIFDFLRGLIEGIDWAELPGIIWDAIVEFVQGIDFHGLSESFGALLGSAAGAIWTFVLSTISGIIEAAKDYFGGYIEEAGGNVIEGIWNGIKDAMAGAWQWLCDNVFNPILDGFVKFFKIGSPSKLMEEQGTFIMEGLFNGISSMVQTIVDIFVGLGEMILNIWNAIKTTAVNLWNGIKTALSSIAEGIKSVFITVWTAIKTFLSTTWNAIKTTTSSVWNGIKTTLSTIWNTIKTTTSTVFNSVKTTISSIWNGIKTTINTVINGIKTVVSSGFNAVKSVATSIFSGLRTSVVNIFQGVWNGVRGVINSMLGGVQSMANGVVSGINAVISSLNSINFSVPSWVPMFGGRSFGINLGYVGYVSIPRLAEGAVIPPNNEFIAMLGDQKSGTNIEAPLETIKDAVRDVVGEDSNFTEEMVELLQELIDVVASKNLTISKRDVGKAALEYVRDEKKRTGNTPIYG